MGKVELWTGENRNWGWMPNEPRINVASCYGKCKCISWIHKLQVVCLTCLCSPSLSPAHVLPLPLPMSFYWHLSLSQRVRVLWEYKATIWDTIFDALSCQARIPISISSSQVDFSLPSSPLRARNPAETPGKWTQFIHRPNESFPTLAARNLVFPIHRAAQNKWKVNNEMDLENTVAIFKSKKCSLRKRKEA